MQPNVLYLVLDCLRRDAIDPDRTPTLAALAHNNCSFEQCVAPANWSLPSHASIFTGEYPHEHGVYHRGHRINSLPLIDAFADRGYRTVGVTSNIYFSRGQGFDAGFDNFYETRRPLNVHGLNPFSAVREREGRSDSGVWTYLSVLGEALRHDRAMASVQNFIRAIGIELDRRYDHRRTLPWHDNDDYGFLRQADHRSERVLVSEFERHCDANKPLFMFANLMGTHFPYEPTAEHFAVETNGDYTLEDLRAIDPDVSNSWVFLNEVHGDGVDERDLELVRAAYRAEARTIDERVGRLLSALERLGLREDTLIVVTSDHGEALGETDLRGERAMGHLDSLNEHLRTVPLILVHPEIKHRRVERPASLTALSRQLQHNLETIIEDSGEGAVSESHPVTFQVPANPHHASSYHRYDDIPEWYIERETMRHTVLRLEDRWAVAADSDGTTAVWEDGKKRTVTAAPADLIAWCEEAVSSYILEEHAGDPEELPGDLEQQLKDLGYI